MGPLSLFPGPCEVVSLSYPPGRRLLLPATALLLLVFASAAHAAPLPVTQSWPIRIPSMGNVSVGTATSTVTFTDTNGTATIAAPNVALGPGQVRRIDTCIKVRVLK